MKTFVIGILSFFENENRLFKVTAENEVDAMKQALIEFTNPKYREDQIEWNKTIGNTVAEIQDACFNSDMSITTPMEI